MVHLRLIKLIHLRLIKLMANKTRMVLVGIEISKNIQP